MRGSGHRLFIAIVATGLAAGLATGPTPALQTSTEFSSKIDFTRYKTWSWGQSDVPANPVAEKRIQDDVEAALAAKGWTKVDSGQGEAVVSVHGVVKDQQNYDVLYQGWAPGWNWTGAGIGTGVGTTVNQKIRSGTLVIDVFDAATKTLAWRGTAEGAVGPPEEVAANMKKIDMAVEKLLKGFPPKPAATPAPAATPSPAQAPHPVPPPHR